MYPDRFDKFVEFFKMNLKLCKEHSSAPNSPPDIDTFELDKLPAGLLHKLLSKFDFVTYTWLVQCSKRWKSGSFRRLRKVRLPNYVYAILVRYGSFTPKTCGTIMELFRMNKTSAKCLEFTKGRIRCNASELEQLMEVLQVVELQVCDGYSITNDIIRLQAVRNLKYLSVSRSEATDVELLGLRVPTYRLFSNNITSGGVIQFLKEWQMGKREINWCTIGYVEMNSAEMVHATDAKLIWSPEIHRETSIGSVPMEAIQEPPPTVYFIQRLTPSTGDQTVLTVQIFPNHIDADLESIHLDKWPECLIANSQEFYKLTNRCKDCDAQFCSHFSRFSLFRLGRKFPFVLKTISVLGTILTYCTKAIRTYYFPYLFDNCHLRYAIARRHSRYRYHNDRIFQRDGVYNIL